MSTHTLTLLAIMVLAGAFGGVVNYLIEKKGNPEQSSWLRSIVVGVAASFLVPLFLSMISSDLVSRSESDPGAMLVFTGFCLVAAISSLGFIRRLSDKVLQEVKALRTDVINTRSAVDLLLQVQAEPPSEGPTLQNVEIPRLDKESAAVLDAFEGSPYALRSLEGITHDAHKPGEVVSQTLAQLVSRGYLRRWEGEAGERWFVTPEGRSLLRHDHVKP